MPHREETKTRVSFFIELYITPEKNQTIPKSKHHRNNKSKNFKLLKNSSNDNDLSQNKGQKLKKYLVNHK